MSKYEVEQAAHSRKRRKSVRWDPEPRDGYGLIATKHGLIMVGQAFTYAMFSFVWGGVEYIYRVNQHLAREALVRMACREIRKIVGAET